LVFANQDRNRSFWFEEIESCREGGLESLDRPQGDYVASSTEGLRPSGKHLHTPERKETNHLAEESRLFVIRFNQGQLDISRPQFDWESRKSCSGTEVDDGDIN
jgi:hypothetical protein